jgi:D-alanyl-D-alanine carboxypeptidase/D-alanyl-D-alanine-endopeptidase (penicillin-binding protein 4)
LTSCRSNGRRPAASVIVALTAALAACQANPQLTVAPTAPSAPSSKVLLEREITRILAAPPLARGSWGIVVRSVASGEVLYSTNPRKLMMPASGLKVVTLAAAAERLGWDFTFETRVVADGSIDERFLNGDLIVVGHGDPSLDDWDGAATRLFENWARAIKTSGIDTIGGRIIGNDNALEDALLGSGWAWDDLDRSFATSIGALQFNQNTAQVRIGPGAAESAPASVTLSPGGSGLVLRNLLTTTAPSIPAALETRRLAGTAVLELRGSIPLGIAPFNRNVSVSNPTLYYVHALREALLANGIDVRGPAVDIDDALHAPTGSAGTTLISYRSPPLAALAATMMKQSQNLYAETLLQTIGGPDQVKSILEGWGIPAEDLVMADGSGLSRYNLVTAEAMTSILSHVAKDERLHRPFEASLAVAGRDGTLAGRLRNTAAEGNVRAKTGSFSNARSTSGYVRATGGETLVFSIIANNFGTPVDAIEQAIDAVVVRLAEFKR